MKDIFESPEVMAAYAEVDLMYLMIKEVYNDMNKPQSSLETMIDIATGYADAKTIEHLEILIPLCQRLVKAKIFIDSDYKEDGEALINMVALYEKMNKTDKK